MVAVLSTADVATFVARGFLAFQGIIDDQTNRAAMAEMRAILATWGTAERPYAPRSGDVLSQLYAGSDGIGAVLRHPQVRGIIASLVGDDCRFDHDFVHLRPPHDPSFQHLHADAIIDPTTAFDIQLFYFPHEVAADGGGTGFVPGTHLRHVNETDIGRYQHLLGERQWSGPAGSVLVFHHGLWHRGMANPGAAERLMYKIRLNPVTPQVRRWDTSDLDSLASTPDDHIFAVFDPTKIAMTLRRREQWMGEADYRLELVQRIKLWRYLTGDPHFDIDWYLTRIADRATLTAG
jgi:hypothetical protein